MSKNQNLKHCPACKEAFNWLDNVVFVEGVNAHYHEDCVDLIPIKYTVFLKNGAEHLGDTEEVEHAYETLPEGAFVEDD